MAELELSVVLPCLNEEETIGSCIEEIKSTLHESDIDYEIVIADNGSTDRSVNISQKLGARVVHVARRGYGNAYLGAIPETMGRFILMADSDMSYDFKEIPRFMAAAREGADLVLGSRLRGSIDPGSMPFLHRHLGTPVLTLLLNLMFRTSISDSQSGMRIFTREAWNQMNLGSPGMEYASEMLVKAARLGLTIREIPIHFRKDGRTRPPHLRSFRDGWRHLRFLFLFSPFYLFLLPAALFTVSGILSLGLSLYGLQLFGRTYSFHMSLLGLVLLVVGNQILLFGLFARLHPLARAARGDRLELWFRERFRLEPWMILFTGLTLIGLAGDLLLLARWILDGMGTIPSRESVLIITLAAMVITGIQGFFAGLYLSVLHINRYGLK
ncbi:MAG TPA: glycosyltransferase family 2 protein [Thermoanaerobaculia bacterium]|nr:glycosyltransferase family 2 protein [Thermoanaerobaculia bacterium]HUM28889.1 glycosyltransferase family 2 protein [Thermoanaerobaculia bacterium]HXK67178.1 glycosyltransferase family 2 protein [Thermoanaerobaculia bacterium]